MAKKPVSPLFSVVTDPKRIAMHAIDHNSTQVAKDLETDILKLLDKPNNPVVNRDKEEIGAWNPELQLFLTKHMRRMMDRVGVVTREQALVDAIKRRLPKATNEEIYVWALKDVSSDADALKSLLAPKEAAKPKPQPKKKPKPAPVVEVVEEEYEEPYDEDPEEEEYIEIPERKPTTRYKGPLKPKRNTKSLSKPQQEITRPPATVVGPNGTMRILVEEVIYTDQFVIMLQKTDDPYSFWIPPLDDGILWEVRYEEEAARCIYSGITYDVETTGTSHFIFLISE